MNCFVAITCLLAVTASTRATGLGAGLEGLVYAPGHASVDYYAYPRYAFEYSVKDPHTGDNKAQWEKRDGDVVKGAYQLVEPDGSLRVVEYWADDKSGFNAVVKRIGPNLHPVAAPVAPIYKAPIPLLESHGPVAPISIGPIAKYSGLADAPLLTGPYLRGGHAVSSASIYRPPIVPIKAPVAPILPAPVAHAPIDHGPIISEPIYKAPIISAPIYKAPIVSAPRAGSWEVWSGGYGLGLGGHGVGLGGQGVGLGGHDVGIGGHGAGLGGHGAGLSGHGLELGGHGLGGLGGYGGNLVKSPLAGYGYLDGLGSGLLNKGYYPSVGLGQDYLGYKH